MSSIFSDFIFEAIVVSVSYSDGLCVLNPLNVNLQSNVESVPIPMEAGVGNAGMFIPITPGSRVIAAYTSGSGKVSVAILSRVPKLEMLSNNFAKFNSLNEDLRPYPDLSDGKIVIRGNANNSLSLNGNGDIELKMNGGSGLYFRENSSVSACTLISEDFSHYSEGGRIQYGIVRRISPTVRLSFLKESAVTVPLHADTKYELLSPERGFFQGSPPLKNSYSKRKRNPSISEYKLIINEFSTDSQFTGFDDEVFRVTGRTKLFDSMDTYKRNRDQGNSLHLAEHELIEIIGGNLVDIKGNILDINFNKLSYGATDNTVPKDNIEIEMDRAKRISRRGVGYHFQLTTNVTSTSDSGTLNNFVYDIDKEGIMKMHIPSSSNTGNIPFASSAVFASKTSDEIVTSAINPSISEPVPITLRDEFGEPVFPGAGSQGILTRRTGVRHYNARNNPYFAKGIAAESVFINATNYHNMTSTAERLISNRIEHISIPQPPSDGILEGLPIGKPFEVPMPADMLKSEVTGLKSPFPSFMSVVAVSPGKPAIYTGGDTLMCGVYYPEDEPMLSNSFSSQKSDGKVNARIVDENGKEGMPTGGKSANISLDGSLELSIGKDNVDEKSLVLDTDGSVVAWVGQDKNGRSIVTQTDGEVLLNVGGSYPNGGKKMSIGRFELRVNVSDKGFVGDLDEDGKYNASGAESDYIISISENGLVIAGNKAGAPMIIRNEGSIMIESGSGDVILSGTQVKTIETKGKSKTQKVSGR